MTGKSKIVVALLAITILSLILGLLKNGENGQSQQVTATTLEKIPLPAYARVVAAGGRHTVALKEDGTVSAVGTRGIGDNNEIFGWRDIVSISAGEHHTVGLKYDGTMVAIGPPHYYTDINRGQCDVSEWKNIVQISAGGMHTVGVQEDGTVIATGDNSDGQCNVGEWEDIVAVSAGIRHTIGLKSDGTVVGVGYNGDGQLDISDWRDIVAVSAGAIHTIGLKEDGTVVAAGRDKFGQMDVTKWQDIVQVAAGPFQTLGLKKDGTINVVGDGRNGISEAEQWENIVEVCIGPSHVVGLKEDGTIVGVGDNKGGQLNFIGWKDLAYVSTGPKQTLGIKNDGTFIGVGISNAIEHIFTHEKLAKYDDIIALVPGPENHSVVALRENGKVLTTGDFREKPHELEQWEDIIAISTGRNVSQSNIFFVVGLKADGTVVGWGNNDYGQLDFSHWKDIVAISTGANYTVGLKKDGTVITTAKAEKVQVENMDLQIDLSHWRDIVAISAGGDHIMGPHIVGLKKDGTVVATGNNNHRQCHVFQWENIVAITAGSHFTVGLKEDGSVVAVGSNYRGQLKCSWWEDIVDISASNDHVVGLKADGTVVGAGDNFYSQINFSSWKGLAASKCIYKEKCVGVYSLAESSISSGEKKVHKSISSVVNDCKLQDQFKFEGVEIVDLKRSRRDGKQVYVAKIQDKDTLGSIISFPVLINAKIVDFDLDIGSRVNLNGHIVVTENSQLATLFDQLKWEANKKYNDDMFFSGEGTEIEPYYDVKDTVIDGKKLKGIDNCPMDFSLPKPEEVGADYARIRSLSPVFANIDRHRFTERLKDYAMKFQYYSDIHSVNFPHIAPNFTAIYFEDYLFFDYYINKYMHITGKQCYSSNSMVEVKVEWNDVPPEQEKLLFVYWLSSVCSVLEEVTPEDIMFLREKFLIDLPDNLPTGKISNTYKNVKYTIDMGEGGFIVVPTV